MPDPTSSAAGSYALAATTITITGGVLGVGYDALIYAFLGCLCSLYLLPPMSHRQLLITIITTPILAALTAPLAAAIVADQMPVLAPYREDSLRLVAAALGGVCMQVVVPAIIDFMRRWIGARGV